MIYVDGEGIPLSTVVESAQKSEVNLAIPTIDGVSVEKIPLHPKKRADMIVADKGYDARWLRKEISKRGIKHKIPKRKKKGQTDEPVYNQKMHNCYKYRFIVERTISWFGAYRRLLIRWEHNDHVYEGFFNIACMMVCLRRL